MGRLLNPGLGELLDRSTILFLKIRHAPAHQPTDHFDREAREVHTLAERYLQGVPDTVAATIEQAREHLFDANHHLWHLEDLMASFAAVATPNVHDCARTAVEIWRTNRRRNALIAEINTLAGTDRGPEKL